ncbi:integrase, catalytic region, zinc finger, CCHC-type containing protein [Tanacetum coccineum]
MQAARDRQKSYADLKRKPMEFQVGDKVMLKVSSLVWGCTFWKMGELNLKVMFGTFQGVRKVGEGCYKLELPEELSRFHNTFYVSNLKKCHADEPLAVPLDGLHLDDKLHFVEDPTLIFRRAFFTTPKTAKSMCEDTTPVVSKTRFSVKSTQSKSLDTTPVVSKTKIVVVTLLSAKNKVVQIVLWIVDSGCSKHMTGDRSLLENFVKKFMGTTCLGNDHFTAITDYGDYVQGNITIFHLYYIEGLGHNLFSVGQFCDGDLEVAFRSKTCYVRNLEGDDLLTGARESNLYTISISDMAASSPVCLMSKATLTKSWLWHRRLSHLNLGTIYDLTKHDLVDGLPKFK